MLSETDKYLVDAIRAGDYKAFETLFISYYPALCKYARLYVPSKEIAEDLVQDLFVKIWEQPSILSINISLGGYLSRSIYNNCLNYVLRKHKRSINLDIFTTNKLKELLTASAEDEPETSLMLSELDSAIKKAVERLPSECCKIFLLSREKGLSHKEIASELNISENTVKVQIYRALLKIREALSDYLV